MWTPDKEKEQIELEKLVEKEIKEDYNPDMQQYIQLCKGKGFKK